MRVLQVITNLLTGGAERLQVYMAPALKERGLDVDIMVFNGEDSPFMSELQEKGVHVIRGGEGNYGVKNIFALRRLFKNYDIVHTHNTSPQLFAALASIGDRSGVMLCTTEHNTTNRRRDWWWYAPIDKWMYSRYRSIVCISEKAKTNLVGYLGRDDNISVIDNGVDVKSVGGALPVEREIIGCCDSDIIITMVAGFRPEKDQDTLIRALKLLAPSYKLVLVGDGARRAELETLAVQQKVSDRVVFTGIRTDVPRILKISDIIVMSSHWEGLSLSSIEGMSVGKAFVASNVQGLREVVGGAGLLFEEGNAEQFAAIAEQLMRDKQLYRKTAEKCMQRALDYDVSKMINAYADLYLSMLDGK